MALLLIDLFGASYELPEAFNFDMLVLVIRPAEQKSTRQSITHKLVPRTYSRYHNWNGKRTETKLS